MFPDDKIRSGKCLLQVIINIEFKGRTWAVRGPWNTGYTFKQRPLIVPPVFNLKNVVVFFVYRVPLSGSINYCKKKKQKKRKNIQNRFQIYARWIWKEKPVQVFIRNFEMHCVFGSHLYSTRKLTQLLQTDSKQYLWKICDESKVISFASQTNKWLFLEGQYFHHVYDNCFSTTF